MEPAILQPDLFDKADEYQGTIVEAWQRFTADQHLDPIVPPLIAASWRRSWGRVNPNKPIDFTHMAGERTGRPAARAVEVAEEVVARRPAARKTTRK